MALRPLVLWGLLLATLPLAARGADLVDLTLYGGAFESSTTTAYAEVLLTVGVLTTAVVPRLAVYMLSMKALDCRS